MSVRGIRNVSRMGLQWRRYPSETARRRLHISSRACSSTLEQLLCQVGEPPSCPANKVTVVGIGQVGIACAVTILTQNVTHELALVDMMEDRLKGEVIDLSQGSILLGNAHLCGGKDFAVSANSQLVVVTAGARQQKGESRLAVVNKNVEIFQCIIPELVKHSPNCILVIITNPVDVMAYVAWRLSGLPCRRVISTGTQLDSARLRYFVAERLKVWAGSVHGWVIGEHGDSSVPVWSGVNVAGLRLRELNPALGTADDKENWAEVHKQVVQSAGTMIQLKGYTNWAIGLSAAALARRLLQGAGGLYAASIYAKGFHGIDKEVFLSLPCMVGNV